MREALYVHASAGWVPFPFADVADGQTGDDVFVMPWTTVGVPVWRTGGAVFADRVVDWHATVSVGLQLF